MMSEDSQRRRAEKIARMSDYFGNVRYEVYEWNSYRDESLDFKSMTNAEVSAYLERSY